MVQVMRKPIRWNVSEQGCFNVSSHCKDKDGYPKLKVDNKSWRMSRYIYTQCFGDIPDGQVVMHICDNPNCINPEHLKLGTVTDNNRDKVHKGRHKCQKGENNNQAVLTWDLVKYIRQSNKTAKELSNELGINRVTIHNVKSGRTWSTDKEVE